MSYSTSRLHLFSRLVLLSFLLLGRQGYPVASFLLKGTLSGLLSSSSVKIKNGTDIKTLSVNGAYSFSNRVNQGSSYSVVVDANPVGQTCTVSNGSGTVYGADVTNINVSCSPNNYKVGGTLTGLIGTVVVKNGTTATQSLSSNGAFSFQVPFKKTYAIKVGTHSPRVKLAQ